jgi:LPXTG-motif cell wall-anchored protein
VPWVGGLAWAGYAAGANWQHVQHLVNTPAYVIAGLIGLLVIAGVIVFIVRRRKRPSATRVTSADEPMSVGPSERRRTD